LPRYSAVVVVLAVALLAVSARYERPPTYCVFILLEL
jgi:hypothetical protein